MSTKRPCGSSECSTSTGIHGDDRHVLSGLTFGSGALDEFGYWEHPCAVCARDFEIRHPEAGPMWPFAEDGL